MPNSRVPIECQSMQPTDLSSVYSLQVSSTLQCTTTCIKVDDALQEILAH